MKEFTCIFAGLLIFFPNTLSADQRIDEILKRQCQYLVYISGSTKGMDDSLLAGIIRGMGYVIPEEDRSNLYQNKNIDTIKLKACKNALQKSTSNGFESAYNLEVYKLLSNK